MNNNQKLYEVKIEKNVDKTSLEPYEFTIRIQYTDEAFQERMKNVLEKSPIVLCIQDRGILSSLITKSKQKVFFGDWEEIKELNRNSLRNTIEIFNLKNDKNTFCYKKCENGEEEIHLIQKALGKFLENESKVYKSI
ncbi:hypothetical protein [Bacillus sp. FSL R9-9410]|uniref:hypothetical protein n=1 Tax=Bacillus sp. FSL R9-9410 TaxID=2921590 RepID=UPI003100FDD7